MQCNARHGRRPTSGAHLKMRFALGTVCEMSRRDYLPPEERSATRAPVRVVWTGSWATGAHGLCQARPDVLEANGRFLPAITMSYQLGDFEPIVPEGPPLLSITEARQMALALLRCRLEALEAEFIVDDDDAVEIPRQRMAS